MTYRLGFHQTCGNDTWTRTKKCEEEFKRVTATEGSELTDEQLVLMEGEGRNSGNLENSGRTKREDGKPITNGKIDFVMANPAARQMVMSVEVNFIDAFQHAAIDVQIYLDANAGEVETLHKQPKMQAIAPLEGRDH